MPQLYDTRATDNVGDFYKMDWFRENGELSENMYNIKLLNVYFNYIDYMFLLCYTLF